MRHLPALTTLTTHAQDILSRPYRTLARIAYEILRREMTLTARRIPEALSTPLLVLLLV